ncbi:MAG TPA: glycosyltransferase family 2 protein [Anaerolineae bacterium]|nr:glycosyltransferase family 2 protein [Anaerolineae bacterium]
MSDRPATVIAVIPAYQAAATLERVVRETTEHLPVLVVDDGSTDGTEAVAASAGAQVLRQTPNQGKGAALRRGFREALEQGAQAVLTLDADGQHDPSCAPAFLEAWRRGGAPLVIGRRDFSRMPLSRRIANNLGTQVFSWAVGRHIADNQSGYRLIARPLLPHLLQSEEAGFEFEVEMITDAIRADLAIDWVPIPTIYEQAGSHIRPLAHVSNFLRVARAARRSVGIPLELG